MTALKGVLLASLAIVLAILLLIEGPGAAGTGGSSPGAFVAAPSSPLYVGPMAGRPTVGDVDGNGVLDIVVACGTCCGSRPDPKSGHVVVLLGDGKGGFDDAPGSPIKVASSVRKVALGDLDRNGTLDLVAAEHDSYGVTVLLGDGKGRFRPAPGSPVTAFAGPRPHTHEIALGDVDGDKALDVLTTNANDRTISVLLGDGKGGFKAAPSGPVAAGRHPYDAIAVVDLDGDGHADVVVPDLAGNAILALLGDGKGGFAPAAGSPVAVGERPGYVVTGDFDGDGRVDVCATHDDVGMVDVLLGDGKGGLRPAPGSPVRLEVPVWGLAAADFNRDGKTDLALGSMGRNPVVVLFGDGKGGFSESRSARLPAGESPNYVAAADLNGDGAADVVAGNYGSGDVSVFFGKK